MLSHTSQPIGILGGMSYVSSTDYYRLINQKVNAIQGGFEIPELILHSVNFKVIESCVRNKDWERAGQYLAAKAQQVEQAGAKSLFLATNTMHRVRADIQAAISIPFIDIFETVSLEIKGQGLHRVGLLGTKTVMTDPFYRQAYEQLGLDIVIPNEPAIEEVNRIIWEELTQQQLLPDSKQYYLQVMQNLASQGAQGVILGCTEIKLLVQQEDIPSLPLFDTTELHCDRAAKIWTGG